MESEIAAKLKQNVPVPEEPSPPPPPPVQTDEQSSLVPEKVNELMLLKIGNMLGLPNPNAEGTEKLSFIYSQLKGDSYDSTMENINMKLLELGHKYSPDRLHKLWLWLKLNMEKQAVENEMAKI